MTTPTQQLIARLLEQRRWWVEIAPGKEVRLQRPTELEVVRQEGAVLAERIGEYIVDWRGITEADLLGADQASPEPVAFAPELVAHVINDRPEWLAALIAAMREHLQAHFARRKAASGN